MCMSVSADDLVCCSTIEETELMLETKRARKRDGEIGNMALTTLNQHLNT